jgi:hypothetical protein
MFESLEVKFGISDRRQTAKKIYVWEITTPMFATFSRISR